MKREILFALTSVLFLGFLPSCLKVIDWGKKHLDQGSVLGKKSKEARSYIKTTRVYNQFELQGNFDVLWLSNSVRMIFSDFYSLRRGKSEDQKKVFLRRQLEENNYFISFYLLSLKSIRLGEKDSEWSLFLKVADKKYAPVETRVVDLDPEYKDIFGDKWSKFKDSYLIYFNAKDIEDNFIIDEGTKKISLVFRSLDKETELFWELG